MNDLLSRVGGLPGFFVEIARLCVWLAILAAIFIPLERLWAVHKQKITRKALLLDVSYYFLNSLLMTLFLALPFAAIAWGLNKVIPSGIQAFAGGMPPLARFLAAIVVGEIGGYWGHRLLHEVPALWRFHAMHHSATEIDFMVNCRAHPLDLTFTRMCGYIPLYILGLSQPFSGVADPAFMGFIGVGTIWSFFIHANLGWRFGWLEHLLVTPAYHHWHHTKHDHRDHNYATVLPWVDRLFGTHYLPKGEWPAEYGSDTKVPDTLPAQLVFPFRRD